MIRTEFWRLYSKVPNRKALLRTSGPPPATLKRVASNGFLVVANAFLALSESIRPKYETRP